MPRERRLRRRGRRIAHRTVIITAAALQIAGPGERRIRDGREGVRIWARRNEVNSIRSLNAANDIL